MKGENVEFLISRYKELVSFQEAHFVLIAHEDAMVATVFKITQPNGAEFILKICSRDEDYYIGKPIFCIIFMRKFRRLGSFNSFLQKTICMEPFSWNFYLGNCLTQRY